ncbi:MAG: hypothetical protein AB2813_11685 [Candidatus Sedimenticola endophacoides]
MAVSDGLDVDDMLNRETVIEFYLQESEVDEGLIATNVRKVYAPSHP